MIYRAISSLFVALAVVGLAPSLPAESRGAWYTTESVDDSWKRSSPNEIHDLCTVEDLQEALALSYDLWQETKVHHDNSYRYTRAFASWTRSGHRTIVTVLNGVVVERRYERFNSRRETVESWVECEGEIGIHPAGEPPLLVDDLYVRAAEEYLTQDPAANELSLELWPNGLLRSCVYVPHNCADDCSEGIRHLSIELGL